MLQALGVAAADIADVTEAVLSGADYQRDLPAPTPAVAPEPPPEWWLDFLEWLSGGGGIAEAALWVFGAGIVIWVLVQLLQLRGPMPARTGGKPAPAPAEPRSWTTPTDRADAGAATLESADGLAAERRYGEAVHALLLHCVGEIKRRAAVADSLTGREIVRRSGFSDEARTALRRLVAGAEKSHFGGYPAAEDDYRTCRRDCQQVVAAMAPA